MRLTRVASLALALAWAPSAGAQLPAPDPFAAADAAIRAEMAKAGIPGAAVAVVVGDTVVWARGFGVANAETGAPVTPDTLFQIGSVTKSFTAAALLTAAAQGAIALDQPVATYRSGLTPSVGALTLTQLLSHTGGLIDEPGEFGPHGDEGLVREWPVCDERSRRGSRRRDDRLRGAVHDRHRAGSRGGRLDQRRRRERYEAKRVGPRPGPRHGASEGGLAELQRRTARLRPPPPPLSQGLLPAKDEIALPADAARPYVGVLTNARRFTAEVVQQGDGLVLKRFGRDFPMRTISDQDQFLVALPREGTETIA